MSLPRASDYRPAFRARPSSAEPPGAPTRTRRALSPAVLLACLPEPRSRTNAHGGADIRGYYAALGIHLVTWAQTEASVRCFVNPDAHRRGDRDPSCSVNLEHGAWHCHGCSEKGGAFDAATKTGHSDRAAIDLMVRFGITPRREEPKPRRPPRAARKTQPPSVVWRTLTVREPDVQRWHSRLDNDTALTRRLTRERGWRKETICELQLGVCRGRITIPVRDNHRRLIGLLRYQPWPQAGEPKMRAAAGSRRMLLPHPTAEPSHDVLLVEGEPDMLAARSHELPAIALPGIEAWRAEWASLFAGRHVSIVMDADHQGRAAARRIADDLASQTKTTIVDIDPERDDGYDLTDWIMEGSPNAETINLGSPINARSDDGD